MSSLLLALLIGVPAVALVTVLFTKERQILNADHKEAQRRLKKQQALWELRYANYRDEYSDTLKRK